jgi:hypothetical protein
MDFINPARTIDLCICVTNPLHLSHDSTLKLVFALGKFLVLSAGNHFVKILLFELDQYIFFCGLFLSRCFF